MTVSQQINHVNDDTYDVDITVTDVPKSYFLAITKNNLPEGAATREIVIDLLPLEQAPGGTRTTNTNLFRKGADETAIQVKVMQDGKELAENTQAYS